MSKTSELPKFFYADDRPLHRAIIKTHPDVTIIEKGEDIMTRLENADAGILLLDADYITQSGYAICEEVKARLKDKFRVHILSNESSYGVQEKADYAAVDKLIIVPENMEAMFLP